MDRSENNYRDLRRKANRKVREEATPVQKARMREAAKAIQDGRIKVPLTCGWCHSPGIVCPPEDNPGHDYECLSCGRRTARGTARTIRLQKLEAIIKKGLDVPGLLPKDR